MCAIDIFLNKIMKSKFVLKSVKKMFYNLCFCI